ncbi:MAG: hypothetical protein HYU76_14100 [Betaproteobacteria bacterium]|nr:hypothetical protein [Betaproteobacteria bacterium]
MSLRVTSWRRRGRRSVLSLAGLGLFVFAQLALAAQTCMIPAVALKAVSDRTIASTMGSDCDPAVAPCAPGRLAATCVANLTQHDRDVATHTLLPKLPGLSRAFHPVLADAAGTGSEVPRAGSGPIGQPPLSLLYCRFLT